MATEEKPVSWDHVEESGVGEPTGRLDEQIAGTVKLTEETIVYIPTPTADPQDPLNMATWHKTIVLILISIFSTLGLALVGGFGGLLQFYIPDYSAAGKDYADMSHLITYPTLFMGIGNLIGMPIAIGVGRRIVLLVSTVIMMVAAVLCAVARDYEWHLAARIVLGLAAGQSEALVPLIAQEIFFLHERGRSLMIQQAIQVTLMSVWVLFASEISAAITPQWWYGLGVALSGVQLVLTFFLVPETKYDRPVAAYRGGADVDDKEPGAITVCRERPELDFVNFEARTWKSDMRLWVGTPDWRKVYEVLLQTFQLLLFPNIFWVMCLNGLTLGVNIAMGTTYGSIVGGAPYNWPERSISYINCGQIITALIGLPFFGHGSDLLIKWFADRRNGMHEPEVRIFPIFIPIAVGTFTAVLYGQAAGNPEDYHWFVYVWGVAAYFFCFLGANMVGITYLLDSYPSRSGPLLVIICAFRGVISFGTSYGIAPFVEASGWEGAFGTFGGLTAAFGLLGIPVIMWGKTIRRITSRFVQDKATPA